MDAEDLRLAVYRAFAETGRAPEPDELAAKLGTEAREVAAGLAELARGRHLALDDQGQIVMAHRPPDGGQVAHFLVPAARMWDDVVHTCAHQRLFCSENCVSDWLAGTGSARGYVLDLGTLWRLAAHWYDGRLDRGYVRREPSQAAAYLRSVGLAGPFWGL
jgi:hypothetical protein